MLYLCDSSGVCLYEADAGVQIRASGFQFTAFVKTDHFRKLNEDSLLVIEELSPVLLEGDNQGRVDLMLRWCETFKKRSIPA